MPKVSVIIPVYNTETFLKRCLDSVCNQTLSDIEIICVNDCSTDNSLNILKEYNVKIIDLKKNKGVSYARNTGITNSEGEYIGFIDSDDFISPDFYEKLYTIAKAKNADCVKGNIYNFEAETGKSYLSDFYNMNNRIGINKSYFCYAFTSAIYRRDVIQNNNIMFPENISFFEDPYFSIKFSAIMQSIEIVDSAIYYYTIHNNSKCFNSKTTHSANDFLSSIKAIIKVLNNAKISKNDYLIYTNFLLEQVIPWCGAKFSDAINNIALEGVLHILNQCKYSQKDILAHYFMEKKKKEQKIMIKNLRKNLIKERLVNA